MPIQSATSFWVAVFRPSKPKRMEMMRCSRSFRWLMASRSI